MQEQHRQQQQQQQQLQQHQQQQQQQYDLATAMANCLVYYRAFAKDFQSTKNVAGPEMGRATALAAQLVQLQDRILKRVVAGPLAVGSSWPLLLTAGAAVAHSLSQTLTRYQYEGRQSRYDVRSSARQYIDSLIQLRSGASALTASQLAALVDSLFAITIAVMDLALPAHQRRPVREGQPVGPALLEVLALQRELQILLAAESSSQLLSAPLPPAFLAQRSNEVHRQFEDTT